MRVVVLKKLEDAILKAAHDVKGDIDLKKTISNIKNAIGSNNSKK